MKNFINFGLVGCGRISPKHLSAIKTLPNTNLIAVCDIKEERAREAAKEYNCKYYTNYDEMLKDKDIDMISICTPSGLHPEMVIKAANTGKHVLTEKPMALNLKDAEEMINVCKEKNVKLFVVKQNRYNPPVIEAKKALDSGRFGDLILLNITVRWYRPKEYYDQDEWRGTKSMDGGVFSNQALHQLDLLRWFGGPIKNVFAKIDNLNHPNIEVEDTGVAIVKFKNGALGVIEATTCAYPKNLEGSLTILGSNGSVKIGGPAVNKMELWEFKDYDNEDNLYRSKSTNPSDVYGFGHLEVYKNIIDSILNNKIPFVDGIEGKKSLELLEAIYKSSESGKEIELNENSFN